MPITVSPILVVLAVSVWLVGAGCVWALLFAAGERQRRLSDKPDLKPAE